MTITKRTWIIHPFLIGLYPVALLYIRNLPTVAPGEVLIPGLLVVAITLAVWSAFRWLWNDGIRAALVASSVWVLFFSFATGVRLAERAGIGGDILGRERIVLAVEILAGAAVVAIVWRLPGLARALHGGFNVAAITLVGLSLCSATMQATAKGSIRPPSVTPPAVPATQPRASLPPDIYYVVLDAYGRSDVLDEFYGFDNEPFLNRLEQRGFYVARRSTANYCQTALSLSSTLNLRYHDDLAGSPSQNRLPLKSLIANNAVVRALRPHGYRFVSFSSGFQITEMPGADAYHTPRANLGEFGSMLVAKTPLWLMLGLKEQRDPHRMHRERILHLFDRLPAVADPDRPTFTFAHVLSPHPPFVFDADGGDTSGQEREYSLYDGDGWIGLEGHGDSDDYARRYRAQITYITRRVEEVVDRILQTSKTPPIIIIQGDHGPASHFAMSSERPQDLRERMAILNAYYLPDGGIADLDPTITPVNSFRVVLDRYFGSHLGRLEDRNYYSSYPAPYVFTDVTGQVEDSRPRSDRDD
ncbi:sulfatase-like hydrolase/transferase [Tundrisphaera sp. TA3]|uniref:sulfatase-like hydrolase/transferase n=1 Tax=Tundrisphaera sp. TA3 TaxID=3435775 RepID=UPI003EBB3717